jgi:hypothetical protein
MPLRRSAATKVMVFQCPCGTRRRIVGNEDLREAFVRPLFLARRVLEQERRQRGRKVYSLHAPEVECIGKGKAHRPYEFGVKGASALRGGYFYARRMPGKCPAAVRAARLDASQRTGCALITWLR